MQPLILCNVMEKSSYMILFQSILC